MTLGELVDSGIVFGDGCHNVFVSAPSLTTDNEECILHLPGIIQNRGKFESVFRAEVQRIYPKTMWSTLLLQIDVAEYDNYDSVKEAIING